MKKGKDRGRVLLELAGGASRKQLRVTFSGMFCKIPPKSKMKIRKCPFACRMQTGHSAEKHNGFPKVNLSIVCVASTRTLH
jgi:hypothetical protein